MKKEIAYINSFLPTPLTKEQVEEEVIKIKEEQNLNSFKDLGYLIKQVQKEIGNRTDNITITTACKKILGLDK